MGRQPVQDQRVQKVIIINFIVEQYVQTTSCTMSYVEGPDFIQPKIIIG
jgi:hypothetical protein